MSDTNGNPISVTLLADPLAQQLKTASQTGSLQINTRKGHKNLPQGATSANIEDLMHPLGLGPTGSPYYRIPIVNSLPTPLDLVDSAPVAGSQVGYPATADFGKHASQNHRIPATFDDPTQPGRKLYGVGLYHFQFDQSFEFEYALSFSYKPGGVGPKVAIAIKFGTLWMNPIWAVTADVSTYNSVGGFYDSLSSNGKTVQSDVGAETTIWASYSGGTYFVWIRDSKSTD
ncbi:MAG: hypothetical protein M3O31_03715 [Acidobacteriota bacterium]|nr:hypothetical protein [Acidobacteriota bacterium]